MRISNTQLHQNISLSSSRTKVVSSFKHLESSIYLDISQQAGNSKYWNDSSINFPIINKNVQSYTKDLTLVLKDLY